MSHYYEQRERSIQNDSAAVCNECGATDKTMSNANGRFWLCDDCKIKLESKDAD